MEFVFWQNIISFHQSSFLRCLAQKYPVTLVVERDANPKRLNTGWYIPDMGKCNVLIAPSDSDIQNIINKNIDSIHIFSTIHAYRLVRKAFAIARKKHLKILITSEPYNNLGWKGVLRGFIAKLEYYLYDKYIDGLLLTGDLGCECFKKAGFSESKIYQWAYFVENDVSDEENRNLYQSGKKPLLLFVGSIDERKNILSILPAIERNYESFDQFMIVGDGPLKKELIAFISNFDKIKYIPNLSNIDVKRLMLQYDLLILPSLFDGWGAVVNEALNAGMRVLCSDHCGASTLLKEKYRGDAFSDKDDFDRKLIDNLNSEYYSPQSRRNISSWARVAISGEKASSYFVDICEFIYYKRAIKPIAPWLNNK